MSGLMVYLTGPGRANEHSEPHLVAGDPAMMAWHDDAELDRAAALRIARHLDRPRRAFGTHVTGGHVWHCSLSLRAEEGQLTDEKWREISEAFVERMGFGTAEDTKAPVRWVAVRHGVSTGGNDHVHLVVDLVREDGTKASIHNDRIRARDTCRELEKDFGLEVLESASRERSSVAFSYGEREAVARRRARGVFEKARRTGAETRTWATLPAAERTRLVETELRADQPRWELARAVRAHATASADEAEFVRRLRAGGPAPQEPAGASETAGGVTRGLLVRPRFADGRDDVVVGYSVAARPVAGERPIWYGGGHLAKDLTLPRLRAEWPDTPQHAAAAAAEWTAARRGRRPVTPGWERRELAVPDAAMWQQVGRDLEQLRVHLATVPHTERDTWARAARHGAGALAAWSARTEATPGPLAAAADALARSAETTRAPRTPAGAKSAAAMPSAAGAAYVLLSATLPGAAGQLAMLKSLANLARALYDMHQADGAARRANAIHTAVRTQLSHVNARLLAAMPPAPAPPADRAEGGGVAVLERTAPAAVDPTAAEAARIARIGQSAPQAPRTPGGPASPLPSPLPNPLPERPPAERQRPGARPGGHDQADRGTER